MSLGQKFNRYLEQWRQHVLFGKTRSGDIIAKPSIENVTSCKAYEQLRSLGPEILPLIKQLRGVSDSDMPGIFMIKEYGLPKLIKEITK